MYKLRVFIYTLATISIYSGVLYADEAFLFIRVTEPQTEVGVPFKTGLTYPIAECAINLQTGTIAPPDRFGIERRDAIKGFVEAVKNPPPQPKPVEPTKEELQDEIARLQADIDAKKAKLDEITKPKDNPVTPVEDVPAVIP